MTRDEHMVWCKERALVMKAGSKVFATFTSEEREAWHRFTINNDYSPACTAVAKKLNDGMTAELAILRN